MDYAADLLTTGDFAVDIGANVGEVTKLYAGIVGVTGRVLAFEPHPICFNTLCDETHPYPQVVAQQIAVADRHGSRPFYADSGDSKRSSLYADNVIQMGESYGTTTDTLDRLLSRYRAHYPKLIKVDAQGAEPEILRGATDILDAGQSVWFLEIWPVGIWNAHGQLEDVIAPFESRGYTVDGGWDDVRARASRVSQRAHKSIDVMIRPKGQEGWGSSLDIIATPRP